MASLQLTAGTVHEEPGGKVEVEGGCVKLLNKHLQLVMAYFLRPGEIVRRSSEGVYVVEL